MSGWPFVEHMSSAPVPGGLPGDDEQEGALRQRLDVVRATAAEHEQVSGPQVDRVPRHDDADSPTDDVDADLALSRILLLPRAGLQPDQHDPQLGFLNEGSGVAVRLLPARLGFERGELCRYV